MSKSIQEVLLETFGGKLPEYYKNLTPQMKTHVEAHMAKEPKLMSEIKRGAGFVGVSAKKQKDVVLTS